MTTAWGNTPGTNRGEDILVTGLTAAGNYMSVGILVDLDNNLISTLAGVDPIVSSTNSISSITGAKFPAFSNYLLDSAEANFGATAFERAIPAGYSAWDAACTWNPSDKDASITLSGSNLIATGTASSLWKTVRGTVSHTSGKWYFEIKARFVSAANGWMVGVANASQALNNYLGSTAGQGFGYQSQTSAYPGGTGFRRSVTTYSNAWRSIFSDIPHNGGRWYVEVLCNAVSASSGGIFVGVANTAGRTDRLRNYLGGDTAGNSAGFQSQRSFYRLNNNSGNVVSGNLTATHVYRLDIDLDAKTIACALDGGAWSAAQSIASLISAGPAVDIYFGVSLLDSPSTFDSVTVNFGATAFTYTAPTGANSWDTTFGSTAMQYGGDFVQVLHDVSPNLEVAAINAYSVMYQNPAEMQVEGISIQVLNLHAPGDSYLVVGEVFANVLRSAIVNPINVGGLDVQALRNYTANAQIAALVAQALADAPANLEIMAITVSVLRAAPSTGGASKFNRAVTITT